MKYWWVNHKQTFVREIEGQYIWSPQRKSNGSNNQTYTNLTLTQPGDVVISYARGLIQAIGHVAGPCRESQKPEDFGAAGDGWSHNGWLVPIDWKLLDNPIHPKDHLDLIKPLLPQKHSPLQATGNGNQGCYLASISDELGNLILSLASKVKFPTETPKPTWKVHVFEDKEEEYLTWIAENPSGFVANMDKAGSMKQYPMIHSVSDSAVSNDPRGNFTTNAYFKITATNLQELKSYLKYKYGHFTYCKKCLEEFEDQQEHDDIKIIENIKSSSLTTTEKEQLVKSRRGQGLFRSRLEKIEPCCRVTGVNNKALLIASHIKPWSQCNNEERLDGNNGLLLSPHVDKLFDHGWITFTDQGDLVCSNDDILTALKQWRIPEQLNVGTFNQKQLSFLAYHRENIYLGTE